VAFDTSRNALIDLPPTALDVTIADACAGVAAPSLERHHGEYDR
jgi:hypothetical protein